MGPMIYDELSRLLLDALKDGKDKGHIKRSAIITVLGKMEIDIDYAGRRASTILKGGQSLKKGEFPVLFEYVTTTFGAKVDDLPEGSLKKFLVRAKQGEDGLRAEGARTDIASTVFGQQLRNKTYAGEESDFDAIKGLYFIVHWGMETWPRGRWSESVSIGNVTYNDEANVCEMVVTAPVEDDEIKIYALGTFSADTYGFFGFQEKTTRLYAMNIKKTSARTFSGVLLTEEWDMKVACKVLLIATELSEAEALATIKERTFKDRPEFKGVNPTLYEHSLSNGCGEKEYLTSYVSKMATT